MSAPPNASRLLVGLAGWLLVSAVAVHAQDAPPPGSEYVLKTGTNLVVVDVGANAADGKPLHGLKREDFQVKQDDKPQQIRNFAEHSGDTTKPVKAPPALKPGLFTNYRAVPTDGPVNVLLLDMLNTPLRDQTYAKQQIQSFLAHETYGASMAIFGLGSKLTILQGFTSDPAILRAALGKKGATVGSSLLNDANGGSDGVNPSGMSDTLADMGTTPDMLDALANAKQFESESQSFQLQQRVHLTVDALNALARYLAAVPGRKNVIWFSGSFPVSVLPDSTVDNGFASVSNQDEEYRETLRLLAREQVSLYPVDVRGVMTSGTYNAASASTKYAQDPRNLGRDLAKFEAQTSAENSSMLEAAHETGGRAILGTNDLTGAVAQAIRQGSDYYTLTYTPTNKAKDGGYRKIAITAPKAATLTYRRGYLADAAEVARPASTPAAQPAVQLDAFSRTMVRGAPASTQILFTARALPTTGVPESAAAPGNALEASNPEAKPPYLRYALDLAVKQTDIAFTQQNGLAHAAFEVLSFVYDADGTLMNRVGTVVRLDLKPATFSRFESQPYAVSQDVSVPAKGSYFLRVAVHDLSSGKTGALEIPLDAIRRLPPLAAPVP